FTGEDRLIVPSLKVATYDLRPEMSARALTDALLTRLRQTDNFYSFILINFANADMVGHTGNIKSTIKACEVVDECLGKIANYVSAYNGILLITGDHGNAEQMINSQTGEVETEHSTNSVLFIAVSKKLLGNSMVLPVGILADVAPTILSCLNISIPSPMLGKNLLSGLLAH
ncbi:MAG: 2,3-bisphosphoglycerate-independent phosphoglycerate mutase, partial [Patescibacteria group bacterium]